MTTERLGFSWSKPVLMPEGSLPNTGNTTRWYSVRRLFSTPSRRTPAPAATGRLTSRATTAMEKVSITRSVRWNGSSPNWGASSTPVRPGQATPEGPGQSGHPVGRDARQLGQLPSVDDRPDLHADAGEAEQQPQGDADHADENDHRQLVGADVQAAAQVDGLRADERRRLADGARPHGVGQAEKPEEDPERGDQLLGLARAAPLEGPEHDALEEKSDARSDHQEGDERGRGSGGCASRWPAARGSRRRSWPPRRGRS